MLGAAPGGRGGEEVLSDLPPWGAAKVPHGAPLPLEKHLGGLGRQLVRVRLGVRGPQGLKELKERALHGGTPFCARRKLPAKGSAQGLAHARGYATPEKWGAKFMRRAHPCPLAMTLVASWPSGHGSTLQGVDLDAG